MQLQPKLSFLPEDQRGGPKILNNVEAGAKGHE